MMDLRPFLSHLETLGELQVVEGADGELEIGAITELSDERSGPALLFDSIKGCPPGHRIITNLLGTPRRLGIAFGFPPDISNLELVYSIKEKLKAVKLVPPVTVSKGSVLENVQNEGDVDLLKFPAPRWHEADGGRYLGTGDMVIMRDPHSGRVNVGTYRIQLHDRKTLGLYIAPGHHGSIIRESYWAQGKPCPVAVVLGSHPLVWMPAFLAFPWGMEEFEVAGALLGEPLNVITGSYTGLPIPADAEIVIEGECPPPQEATADEGRFGEWPGYYSFEKRKEPVIRVKRVMYRNNPIVNGSPPSKPPASSGTSEYVTRAAHIWNELERLGIPGIRGVWNMRAGGIKLINVISIEQKYAGHAKQVAMAAMSGAEGACHGRFIIVVDEDIYTTNDEDVLWAMATRCDPATSMEIVTGCWASPVDPLMSPEKRRQGDLTNTRAIVLACRPYHWRKEFPRVNRASNALRELTLKKWGHLFAAAK